MEVERVRLDLDRTRNINTTMDHILTQRLPPAPAPSASTSYPGQVSQQQHRQSTSTTTSASMCGKAQAKHPTDPAYLTKKQEMLDRNRKLFLARHPELKSATVASS